MKNLQVNYFRVLANFVPRINQFCNFPGEENMLKKQIITILSLVLLSAPVFAKMYRYVDESGEVVYSQFEPATQVQRSTLKPPPPPPSTAIQSQQQLIETIQKREDAKQDRIETQKKADQLAMENKKKVMNCEASKRNLEGLTNLDKHKTVDAAGNEIQYTPRQLKQMIKKAREIMKQDCQ